MSSTTERQNLQQGEWARGKGKRINGLKKITMHLAFKFNPTGQS